MTSSRKVERPGMCVLRKNSNKESFVQNTLREATAQRSWALFLGSSGSRARMFSEEWRRDFVPPGSMESGEGAAGREADPQAHR